MASWPDGVASYQHEGYTFVVKGERVAQFRSGPFIIDPAILGFGQRTGIFSPDELVALLNENMQLKDVAITLGLAYHHDKDYEWVIWPIKWGEYEWVGAVYIEKKYGYQYVGASVGHPHVSTDSGQDFDDNIGGFCLGDNDMPDNLFDFVCKAIVVVSRVNGEYHSTYHAPFDDNRESLCESCGEWVDYYQCETGSGCVLCPNCRNCCDHCDDMYHINQLTRVGNNDLVCDNCLQRYYIQCEVCNQWVEESDTSDTDEGEVCDDCLYDFYYCDICGYTREECEHETEDNSEPAIEY